MGVDAIFEGSLFREGNLVRVTVQLIRADTDTHLWAQTYTKGVGNILLLQRDVASDIAHEIGARITTPEQTRTAGGDPVDPEAYRLTVLGHRLRQRETEPELYEALDHFQRALEIAPEYARAYWEIAETWISLAGWAGYVPPREGFPSAKAAATKALRANAEALLQPLEENRSHRNPYEIALVHLDMGDIDRALRWLLVACEERTPQMAFFQFVQGGKQFDPLRTDARFKELLRCRESGVMR